MCRKEHGFAEEVVLKLTLSQQDVIQHDCYLDDERCKLQSRDLRSVGKGQHIFLTARQQSVYSGQPMATLQCGSHIAIAAIRPFYTALLALLASAEQVKEKNMRYKSDWYELGLCRSQKQNKKLRKSLDCVAMVSPCENYL